MTIQQLQYLLKVYETGSISRAAKDLYVTQSTVSGTISALEEELGVQIFDRTWQGVKLTAQGVRVIELASRVCENCRLLLEGEAASLRKVRVGSSGYSPMTNAFIRTVEEYRDRRDLVFSHLTGIPADTIMEKVALFELELGILLNIASQISRIEGVLKSKKLKWTTMEREIPAVFRIGPGHRLYHKADVTEADFENEVLVDFAHGGVVNSRFLQGRLNINWDRVMYVSTQEARYQLIKRGICYAIGPQIPAYEKEQYGFRDIPLEGVGYRILTITNPQNPYTQEIRRFQEILEEELGWI